MHATHTPPFASPPEPPPAAFDVVLPDALGHPALGFRDGTWFRIGHAHPPRPVAARNAILGHPDAAGPIVQIMCWWIREHPGDRHAVDLATELALLVGDMSRSIPTPRMPAGPRECLPAARDGWEVFVEVTPRPDEIAPAERPHVPAEPRAIAPPERDALPAGPEALRPAVRALPPALPARSGRW